MELNWKFYINLALTFVQAGSRVLLMEVDVTVLSQYVSCTVVVVCERATYDRDVQGTSWKFEVANAKVLRFILRDVKESKDGKYGKYSKYSRYAYKNDVYTQYR